jgi:hypothetical protein
VIEYPHAETHLQVHYLNPDETPLVAVQVHSNRTRSGIRRSSPPPISRVNNLTDQYS